MSVGNMVRVLREVLLLAYVDILALPFVRTPRECSSEAHLGFA